MKIFLDATILVSVLNKEYPVFTYSSRILSLADNKKFEVHVHDNHISEANDLEYGTTSSRPTAAIRRSTNRTQDADAFFMKTLRKVVGEL